MPERLSNPQRLEEVWFAEKLRHVVDRYTTYNGFVHKVWLVSLCGLMSEAVQYDFFDEDMSLENRQPRTMMTSPNCIVCIAERDRVAA